MDEITEWVPAEWDSVEAGSRVKATRDQNVLVGTLHDACYIDGVRVAGRSLWDLFVPAPPKPELPTEPGVYKYYVGPGALDDEWHTDGIEVHLLNSSGRWVDVSWGTPDDRDSAGLVLLEPRAVTAKAVLDRVRAHVGTTDLLTACDSVAADFDVTP